ncbi:Uncharacterised protein [Citrobacter braakii]|nr:Uncharacterised protein [Citrobacter braakii]
MFFIAGVFTLVTYSSKHQGGAALPPSGIPHHDHTVNDSTFSKAARSVCGVNVTGSA